MSESSATIPGMTTLTVTDYAGIIGLADPAAFPGPASLPDPPIEIIDGEAFADYRDYPAELLADGRLLLWASGIGGGRWEIANRDGPPPSGGVLRRFSGVVTTCGLLCPVALTDITDGVGEGGFEVPAGPLLVVVSQLAASFTDDGPHFVIATRPATGDQHPVWAEPAWIDEDGHPTDA